jgi:hypothetical protein
MGEIRKLTALSVLLALLLSAPLPSTANLKIDIKANPITLPDRNLSDDCSFTVISVNRLDKKPFEDRTILKLETSVEEGEVKPNLARQITNERGLLTVNAMYSQPKAIDLQVQLCSSDLPPIDPTYMWAYVTLISEDGSNLASSKVKIPILKPTSTSSIAKTLMRECLIGPQYASFGTNFVVEVTRLQMVYDWYTESLMGASVDLRGTVIRNGLLVGKQRISVIPSGETKAVASTQTDVNGQFKLSLNVPKSRFTSNGDSIGLRLEAGIRQIGDQRIVEPGASDWISFGWGLVPQISALPSSSWLPSLSQSCIDAFGRFAENKDDKNRGRHLLYIAARKLWGVSKAKSSDDPAYTESARLAPTKSPIFRENFKDKKSYSKSINGDTVEPLPIGPSTPSSSENNYECDGPRIVSTGQCLGELRTIAPRPRGSNSGSCHYVSGHRRNGTWVNGYWRNC